jgi:hypothetical protein
MTKQTKQIFPYSVGFDCGNGIVKVAISGHGVNLQHRFPSYFLDVTNCPHDHSNNRKVKYLKAGEGTGEKAKLLEINQTIWLAGDDAHQASAERRVQVFGDKDKQPGKVALCLPLFLSLINQVQLPESKRYEFRVAASIHDAEAFGENISNALQGEHLIEIGGKQITVVIHVLKVFDEGYQFKPVGKTLTTTLDLGNGTSILSRFSTNGDLLRREIPLQIGVQHLYKLIFSHPDFRKIKGSENDNRVLDLIRRSIEAVSGKVKPTIKYGFSSDAEDITDIYRTCLSQWYKEYLLSAIEICIANQKDGDRIVVIGGGSQLPYLVDRFNQMKFLLANDPVNANVKKLLEFVQGVEATTENVDELKAIKTSEDKPKRERKKKVIADTPVESNENTEVMEVV